MKHHPNYTEMEMKLISWNHNYFLFLVSCFLSLYTLLPLVFIQDNNMILHLYPSEHLNESVWSVGAKP
jgi:hypothetical protein